MHNKKPSIEETFQEFKTLHSAIIDSSSIIYLSKINALAVLSGSISLWTVKNVLKECSITVPNITIFSDNSSLSTDQQLIDLSIENNTPVISEDFKILSAVSKSETPYFNTLMMTCYLLFMQKISKNEFLHYRENLKSFARYNSFVWDFGEELFSAITSIFK